MLIATAGIARRGIGTSPRRCGWNRATAHACAISGGRLLSSNGWLRWASIPDGHVPCPTGGDGGGDGTFGRGPANRANCWSAISAADRGARGPSPGRMPCGFLAVVMSSVPGIAAASGAGGRTRWRRQIGNRRAGGCVAGPSRSTRCGMAWRMLAVGTWRHGCRRIGHGRHECKVGDHVPMRGEAAGSSACVARGASHRTVPVFAGQVDVADDGSAISRLARGVAGCCVDIAPSDACGLGRAPAAASPARKASRLRFRRHRVALLPHHCRPQGWPQPPMPGPRKPHPRGRTPAQRRRNLPGRARGSPS